MSDDSLSAWRRRLEQAIQQSLHCLCNDLAKRPPAYCDSLRGRLVSHLGLEQARKWAPDQLAEAAVHLAYLRWFQLAVVGESDELEDGGMDRWAPVPDGLAERIPRNLIESRLADYASGGPLTAYFHEWLTLALDSDARQRRGAYYTPYPIAQYIVKQAFHCFADEAQTPTLLTDPACGSGIFLQAAAEFLDGSTSPQEPPRPAKAIRLLGLDISSGSVASAASLLQSRRTSQSLRFAIANTLDLKELESIAAFSPRRLLVLGNPPYSSFHGAVHSPWFASLMDDYKRGLSEKKHSLHDLYVQFLRWAHYHVLRVGEGVIGMVVNHSFLDGLTHRVMRERLLRDFDDVHIVDLHGNVASRATFKSAEDDNVFGIRQGVAIALFIKRRSNHKNLTARKPLCYASLYGSREHKLRRLRELSASDDAERSITPQPPLFLFNTDIGASTDQVSAPSSRLDDRPFFETSRDASGMRDVVSAYSSGVQTKWDAMFVDFDPETLSRRIARWLDGKEDETCGQTPSWLEAKRRQSRFDPRYIRRYMTAPLDVRYVYYDPKLIGRARLSVMKHIIHGARGLVFMRQSKNPGQYDHFLAVDCLVSDRVFYSAHGAPFLAPIINTSTDDLFSVKNLQLSFLDALSEHLRWEASREQLAEKAWSYFYALFHTSQYRLGFRERLRSDFPPIPLPSSLEMFEAFADSGDKLANLHIEACQELRDLPADKKDRAPRISPRVEYDQDAQAIRIAEKISVRADSRAYDCRIGGYPVLKRWLSQRRGKPFSSRIEQELSIRIRCLSEAAELIEELNQSPLQIAER